MSPIRIGCVQYLNTLPLIEGLQSWQDARIVTAVPSRLIGMLRSGEVDVALASVIDAAGPGVVLLPAGMIGCDGATLTVRLFSRVPIGRIASVGIDTDSHTSAALVRVILARRHGVRPRVADFDARERVVLGDGRNGTATGPRDRAEVDALLLIGDKVVTDPPDTARYPYQLDLGEAWKEMTGLPFVYAVWMCRAGEERTPAVRAAAAVLDRQRRHNATRLGWIVGTRATERHWPEREAARYVGTLLKYDVGEAERESVAKFLAWAAELGLCPPHAEPAWADPEA